MPAVESETEMEASDPDMGPEEIDVATVTAPTAVEPPDRESLRGLIAKLLVFAFIAQVTLPIIIVMVCPSTVDAVLRVLTIIISPTVAILGAVIGFYFGSKPRSG